ncbi:MAG: hypothetical protein IT358_04345, partial [Gemmatimonadaceae bacterium]|nr:hypothetical protein [Gemmatimonadaceae bacterium]
MTALALAALVSALAAAIPMPNVVEGQPRPSRTGGSRPGIDVLHYDFRVDFSPRGLDDTVRVASVVTIARTARADSLVLDLRPA